MLAPPGYTATEKLHESSQSVVYRGRRSADGRRVVIKILNDEYPSPARLARFTREFQVVRALAGDGVVEAHGIERYRSTSLILFEDFGGEALSRTLARGPLTPAEVCRIGARLAEIVGRVHGLRVIHKDLNPANVVYNRETGQLKLIDFGIATALSREEPEAVSIQALEGTLAYIAPEQTGRMNRGIDHRADLYALGATLYHLAAGRPPFLADDALELIHCHLARLPAPPAELDPRVPAPLSAIIMKLLAKAAEERYQSAAGVRADLARCLADLERGAPALFELGRGDAVDRLLIPEKLYGREREVEALLKAFARAASGEGGARLVLVPGPAGVGKSSLIHELYRPILARRGYFAAGKFDQLRRDTPYQAFIQAFREILRQILTEGDEEIALVREALAAALGPNGRVLLDVLPEAAPLLGEARELPPLPELLPVEAQRRFHLALRGFVGALASARHPLVIVLDDLQWADGASLKLLELLAADPEVRHALLLGAYRDNEVDAAHPLSLALRAAAEAGAEAASIALRPLGEGHVGELVTDALRCPAAEAAPLARLCFERTAGNPFFLGRFLETLHAEGLLRLDPARGGFSFRLEEIQRVGITDNVVELMAARIRKLPEASQRVTRLAACVGNTFALSTLAVASGRPRTAVAEDLWPALEAGIVIPLDAAYKFVADTEDCEVRYRFAHDRVQQAAYSLLPGEERAATHLGIGRLLRAHAGRGDGGERLFEICGHLNLGRALIEAEAERDDLAALNLEAGLRASAAAAHEAARSFLAAGLELLGPEAWERRYALWLSLATAAASAAHLTGDRDGMERMERLVDEVIRRGRTVLDRVRGHEVRVQAYIHQGREADSLRVGLTALEQLGVRLPARGSKAEAAAALLRLKLLLAGGRAEALARLPRMTDPQKLAAMRLLARVSGPIYNTAVELIPALVLTQLRLTLEHGAAPESVDAFSGSALICATLLGDVTAAERLSQLALQTAERPEVRRMRAKTLFIVHCFVSPWCRPLRDTLEPALSGYRGGLEVGDLEFGLYDALLYVGHGFHVGLPLEEVDRAAAAFGEVMRRIGDPHSIRRLHLVHQPVQNLMGRAPDPTRLTGAVCDEEELLRSARAKGDRYSEATFHVIKLTLCVLFGDPRAALAHAEEASRLAEHMLGTMNAALLHVYWALAALALADQKGGEGEAPGAAASLPGVRGAALLGARRAALVRAALARRKLHAWARHAPANFAAWAALLDAEAARVAGEPGRAREQYDRAAALGREHQQLHVEALAGELAARFYEASGKDRLAEVYAREAHHAYQRWGALAKARDLEARYPEALGKKPAGEADALPVTTGLSLTTTSTSREEALDFVSLLKASQAISGEIVLDDLVRRLMGTLLEAAGARRGLLLVEGESPLTAEADAASGEAPRVRGGALEGRDDLALSVVRYVERAQEAVVLDDPASSGPFQSDPYVARRRPRSILCMPLLGQKRRVGLLYLENDLTPGVFTPARCRVLELLSAQAAISLENARLYETLDNRVKERTQALSHALDQLRETQQQLILQEKLASLGMLTSGIAHEIKNPLNFVTNFAEVSVELAGELAGEVDRVAGRLGAEDAGHIQEIAGDLRQNVTKIHEHGRRADRIVRAMLEHSRSRVGEAREVDLGTLVREYTSAACQAQRGAGPVAVTWQIDPRIAPVRVVPEEIGRVVLNLASNALYAMEARRKAGEPGYAPALTVAVRDLGDQVEIRVRDNGPGIPAEIREKIWSPFFTTKPTGEGTGLGLSISYDIVVQGHGGAMSLESAPGEGTEFCVRLPRRAAQRLPTQPPGPA